MPIKNEYFKTQSEEKTFSVKYSIFVIINFFILPLAFFMNSSGEIYLIDFLPKGQGEWNGFYS